MVRLFHYYKYYEDVCSIKIYVNSYHFFISIRNKLYLCNCIVAATIVVVTIMWLAERPKLWCKILLVK